MGERGDRALPRKRLRRLIPVALGLVVLALLGFYAALPRISSQPALHRWLEAQLLQATQFEVRFADLRVGRDLSVAIDALTIASPGAEPFLTAESVAAAFHLVGRDRRATPEITVSAPRLHTRRLPQGSSAAQEPLSVPSGSKLAALLRGQRIAVVDGFVHFGEKPEEVLGPSTLVIDSFGAAAGLQVHGTMALDATGSEAVWSIALGPSLAASSASIRAAAPLQGLLRAYAEVDSPDWLEPSALTLALDLRGTDSGRIAFDIDAELQTPQLAQPLPVGGSGELDLVDRSLTARIDVAGFDVRSDDFLRVASGVRLGVELTAAPHDAGSIRLDLAVRAPAGELLWDRYYVDLAQHPLAFSGRVEPLGDAVRLSSGRLVVGRIGTLRGGGTYGRSDRRLRGKLEFDIPGLPALYRLAVREPLAESRPTLAGIEVDGRAIGSLEQSYTAAGARRLHGRVDVAAGSLTLAEPPLRLRGVDLRLPIDLQEGAGGATAASQSGWLHIASMSFGAAAVERLAFPLVVGTNRIATAAPVRIDLFGGDLELTELRADALLGDDAHASLSLALRAIDLEALAAAAGLPRVAGTVSGAIPSLRWRGQEIRSEGEIRADLFGGHLRVRNIAVDELFSPVPALRVDADFDNLSLAQMTRTFNFGRITGVIAGEVEDLVVVDGQPVSFTARVATVPRAAVSQRISVRAIRQISILGGTGGDPLTQGILSLFDEYRYAKMGFRCRLENDRFHLGGVDRVDGNEYLVVGSTLPPRVSVVSHTRVVAFSELVRRLARVSAVEDDSRS